MNIGVRQCKKCSNVKIAREFALITGQCYTLAEAGNLREGETDAIADRGPMPPLWSERSNYGASCGRDNHWAVSSV